MRVLGIDLGGTAIKVCVLEFGDPPLAGDPPRLGDPPVGHSTPVGDPHVGHPPLVGDPPLVSDAPRVGYQPLEHGHQPLLDHPPLVVDHRTADTRADDGPDAVLGRMEQLARESLAAAGPIVSVGLGAPGPLDLERGRTVFMPNLPGWEDVPIVAELESRLDTPVRLINDGRAMTLAEHLAGAGHGCSELACFALGTGVGGGVVVGGRLLLGMNGTVGELGHQTIVPDGPACTCGSRGCLEQYASGRAIAAACGLPTAEDVIVEARAGGERATEALRHAGTMLGVAIANVALVIGPQRVVAGGGVAFAGELLLGPARAELARRNQMMPPDRIEIVPAKLGPQAGVIGAALWGALAGRL